MGTTVHCEQGSSEQHLHVYFRQGPIRELDLMVKHRHYSCNIKTCSNEICPPAQKEFFLC